MLNLTDEQKRMFYTSGYSNNYILTFRDIGLVIDNETIHSETPAIKESICDEEEFTLGGCIASSMEFEVSEILAEDITGLEYTAQLEVKNESGELVQTVPMGVYRVDSAKQAEDKDYKKVTAYDRMYDISEDVAAWYNEYFAGDATHTVKETRESLLTYLGIPFVVQTLPNDDVTLEKTMEVTSMAGTDVLRALCVINGGFGRMNREGKFEVISLTGLGFFPEDSQGEDGNLYPSETLYPEDYFEYLGMSDDENACPEYRSCKYEEYMTMPITCLNIQSTTDDVGVTVGDDLTNPYVITANFFLYGKSQDELAEIGQNILGRIKGVTYRPNTTELDGLPYMECGDVFALEKKNDSVESYIFSRTLSGIQALKDTYEAKGNYIRANEVSSNDEIIQLKGKSLEIKKSVEGLSIEVKDFEEDTASKFEQTDKAITAEVKRATEAEGELSSAIEVTAESITAEVKRATEAEEELSSSLELTAESISAEVKRSTEAEGELSSRIEQNAKEIVLKVDENGNIVEVGLTADPEEGTKFTVTAKNIKLSADELLTILSGGTIELTGKHIKINSDNWSVDETGTMTAKNITISGGNIDLETSYTGDNLIHLRNVTYDAKNIHGFRGKIGHFGERKPDSDIVANVGGYYLDLNTGIIYVLTYHSGIKTWREYSNIPVNEIEWIDVYINTEAGNSCSKYYFIPMTVDDGDGSIVTKLFKEGSYINYGFENIEFGKTIHENRMGQVYEFELLGNICMQNSGHYDDSLNPIPELKTDVPLNTELTSVRVGGYRLVTGTVVIDYTNESSIPSRQYISAPGITADRPAYVCNGDSDAQPNLLVGQTSISPSNYMSFIISGVEKAPARYSFSYWIVDEEG